MSRRRSLTINAIVTSQQFLSSLRQALDWMGISQGRAARYEKLVIEFFVHDKRSRDHIFAYNESCEVIDIHELWESVVYQFPDLKEKLMAVCSKGPTLTEDERADTSSNRPRNDAFAYLLAGKLVSAGLKVLAVDGVLARGVSGVYDADVTIEWNGLHIDFECKRPQSQSTLHRRVSEARDQLKHSGRPGVIAIDCSRFMRPLGSLLEADSADDALRYKDRLLESQITQKSKSYPDPSVLGFLLFARVPTMIRRGYSSILSPTGEPIEYYFRRDSLSEWLIINNSESPSRDVLPCIYGMLCASR